MNTATILPDGTNVKIDQGLGRYTLGTVQKFNPNSNVHGVRGHYHIMITGGFDVFGKPAAVGTVRRVQYSHVSAA